MAVFRWLVVSLRCQSRTTETIPDPLKLKERVISSPRARGELGLRSNPGEGHSRESEPVTPPPRCRWEG